VTECAHSFREFGGVGASRRAVGLTVDGPHGAFGTVPGTFSDLGADFRISRLPMVSWCDACIDLWAKTREAQGTWPWGFGSTDGSILEISSHLS
jgi:hypothetical protein